MSGMEMAGLGVTLSLRVPDSDGMSMKFMLMGAESDLLGGDAGDVQYPYHLINGRVAADPDVSPASPATRCGCGSSTRAATPPTGWRSAATS